MPSPVDYALLFATAHTQRNDGDIQIFASAYLNAVRQEVKNKLDSSSTDVIFNVSPKPGNGRSAWSPEAGIAWKAAREDRLAEAALQLGLAYARLGINGEVRALLPVKTRLFFEGFLLEATGFVDLSFSSEKISLEMKDNNQKITWVEQGQKWKLHGVQHYPEQPFLNWTPAIEAGEEYSFYVIYPGGAITQEYDWTDASNVLPHTTERNAHDATEMCLANDYIRQFTPRCINWLERITAGILLYKNATPGMFSSHSSFLHPGLIWIGSGVNPALCGELLVHESSHHYLNLYKLLGPAVNGKDEQLYYSPIKRASRPLEAVLYAAHAIINMLLYHAEAIQNGASPETHVNRIKFLFPTFVQTHEPLTNTTGLSELGRALYDLAATELSKHDFSWVTKEVA